MLPRALAEPVQRHLARVKRLPEDELYAGYGGGVLAVRV